VGRSRRAQVERQTGDPGSARPVAAALVGSRRP
jgi:hypothetical protein